MSAEQLRAEAEKARQKLAGYITAGYFVPAHQRQLSRLIARWVAAAIRADRAQRDAVAQRAQSESDESIFGRIFGDDGIFERVFGKAGAR